MIDMHCHIIPSIDDGSKSVTETFNMIAAAAKLGYKGTFATPHYIEDRHEIDPKDVENSVEVLNKMLKEKKIDFTIYTGNEIYICNDLLELLQDNKVCREIKICFV